MPPARLLLPALAALVLVPLAGCGPSEYVTRTSSATEQARHLPPAPASEVETQLLGAAAEWMGAPYRFGGTTTSGVDCSALVRAVYAGAFGLRLTRATKTQVHEGHPVGRHELRTGDLVFFRTGPDQRHVGIYLDGGRLLHASSSQNRVMVDDLSREHFQRTYWTARRLLDVRPEAGYAATPPPQRPAPPPTTPPPTTPPAAGPARPGW